METNTELSQIAATLADLKKGFAAERQETQAVISSLVQVVESLSEQVQALRAAPATSAIAPETIGTREAAALWGKTPGYLRECLSKNRGNLPEQWIEGVHFWKEEGSSQWSFSRNALTNWDKNRVNLAASPANIVAHRRLTEASRKAG